jgi:hypothetical protein
MFADGRPWITNPDKCQKCQSAGPPDTRENASPSICLTGFDRFDFDRQRNRSLEYISSHKTQSQEGALQIRPNCPGIRLRACGHSQIACSFDTSLGCFGSTTNHRVIIHLQIPRLTGCVCRSWANSDRSRFVDCVAVIDCVLSENTRQAGDSVERRVRSVAICGRF